MDPERKRDLKRAFKREEKAAARAAMLLDEEQLDDLLEYLDDRLPEEGCDRTLRFTKGWAAENGIDPGALSDSVADFGGYCDCEVLGNVEPESIF